MVTRGTKKMCHVNLLVFISLFLLVIILMAKIKNVIDVSKVVPRKVVFIG